MLQGRVEFGWFDRDGDGGCLDARLNQLIGMRKSPRLGTGTHAISREICVSSRPSNPSSGSYWLALSGRDTFSPLDRECVCESNVYGNSNA